MRSQVRFRCKHAALPYCPTPLGSKTERLTLISRASWHRAQQEQKQCTM